jgi:hypothetical protein
MWCHRNFCLINVSPLCVCVCVCGYLYIDKLTLCSWVAFTNTESLLCSGTRGAGATAVALIGAEADAGFGDSVAGARDDDAVADSGAGEVDALCCWSQTDDVVDTEACEPSRSSLKSSTNTTSGSGERGGVSHEGSASSGSSLTSSSPSSKKNDEASLMAPGRLPGRVVRMEADGLSSKNADSGGFGDAIGMWCAGMPPT